MHALKGRCQISRIFPSIFSAHKYRRYTEDLIQTAVLLTNVTTVRDAARQCGVPEATLRGRLRGQAPRSGPTTILSPDLEGRIVHWLISMAKIGFGQTRADVCNAVKRLLDATGTVTIFKDNRPGLYSL